jgi:hypothetical protein
MQPAFPPGVAPMALSLNGNEYLPAPCSATIPGSNDSRGRRLAIWRGNRRRGGPTVRPFGAPRGGDQITGLTRDDCYPTAS